MLCQDLKVKQACESGDLNSLNELLAHPGIVSDKLVFCVFQTLRDGLHTACSQGHDVIVSHIYSSSSAVYQQMMKAQDDKMSLVHIACKNRHASTVITLLGFGFSDYYDDKQECGLYAASNQGLDTVLEALVHAGGSAEGPATDHERNSQKSPLAVACSRGRLTTVEKLIALGADVNKPTPLLNACAIGHIGICQALFRAGANVNGVVDEMHDGPWSWRPGVTPLVVACDRGQCDVAHLLLNVGADPNPPLNACVRVSPLWTAFVRKQYALIKRLLEAGADVNQDNMHHPRQTLLMDACGHVALIPLVHQFLEFGATVDKIDRKGWTALMHACKTRNVEAVHILIQHGADVTVMDSAGITAVHLSCRMNCIPIAVMLAENGADIYSQSKMGRTPLSFVGKADRKILIDAHQQASCLLK